MGLMGLHMIMGLGIDSNGKLVFLVSKLENNSCNIAYN